MKTFLREFAAHLFVALVLIAAMVAGSQQASGAELKIFYGEVVSVSDVDTYKVKREDTGELIRVRLFGVDGPEIGQDFGDDAADFADELLLGQRCKFQQKGKSYDRLVCKMWVQTASEFGTAEFTDVASVLIAEGCTWLDLRYSRDKNLIKGQAKAKAEMRGLWYDSKAMAPWEWRAKIKAERAKKKTRISTIAQGAMQWASDSGWSLRAAA